MKHIAKYLDSGFYRISDKAAGALVKLAGKPLPRQGYEMSVFLTNGVSGPSFANAWLQRTSYSVRLDAPRRGWVWAIYGFSSPDDVLTTVKLGKQFTFVA